jgi:hypothetical protein
MHTQIPLKIKENVCCLKISMPLLKIWLQVPIASTDVLPDLSLTLGVSGLEVIHIKCVNPL